MFSKMCVVLCAVLAVAASQNDFTRDCDVGYSVKCLKLDIVSYIEKMSNKEEFNVLPGVSVIREANSNENKTSEIVSELARSFPNDADKRLDGFVFAKITNFMKSHTLRLKLLDTQSIEEARSAFQGRKGGKIGKKGGLETILAAAMMMKGIF